MNCPQCNFAKLENDFRVCCAHNHMICKECVENLFDNNVHSCPLCNNENEPLLNNELSNDNIERINNNYMNFHNRINVRNEFFNNDDLRNNEYIVHYLNNNRNNVNHINTYNRNVNGNLHRNSNNELPSN